MNKIPAIHLSQSQGSTKENEQVVQIGKKRNWSSQYSLSSAKDLKTIQACDVNEAEDSKSLLAFGGLRAEGLVQETRLEYGALELGSVVATQFNEEGYPCTDRPSEAACEGGCGCHPMCPDGRQLHCNSYEHFLHECQPRNGEVWCGPQQSQQAYMLKASVSSEDTHMTWAEDISTNSSGQLTDDCCYNANNSYNDDSDLDNAFASPVNAARGSTAALSHYGQLGATGGFEELCGGDRMEKVARNEPPANATSRALRNLDGILRHKVNLEFTECQRSLQGILDKNLGHVQHLLRLSDDSQNLQDFEMGEQGAALKDSECHETFTAASYDPSSAAFEDVESEKMKCMIQLLTMASSITCALTQKNFSA